MSLSDLFMSIVNLNSFESTIQFKANSSLGWSWPAQTASMEEGACLRLEEVREGTWKGCTPEL